MLGGYLWITTEEEREQCFAVRRAVFMEEQGFQNEFDAIDEEAHHLLFLDDEKPIATARLFFDDGVWHIGRVCTLKEYRGQGIGKFLIEECLLKAKELRRSKTVVLGAQVQAKGFYEACGFRAYGEEYDDEGCPHIRMRMELDDGKR